MRTTIANFLRDESGATAIEYGLIAALIAVVIIGALQAVGTNLNATLHAVAAKI
jgi:pilus assembly protein Flp/PilA